MKVIRGLHNWPHELRRSIVTIGNFDGVHRGHQALLQQLNQLSLQTKLPTVLLLFEPQPQEFFARTRQSTPPARLTSFRDKCRLLSQFPIDNVTCIAFNAKQAQQSAEDFIQKVLIDTLHVRHLVVGDDFRFGHQRRGDHAMLKEFATENDFTVASMSEIADLGERISSTRIRGLLAENKLAEAATLLGRPFTLSGRVVHGDERGRTIGFPTANIPLKRAVSPLHGVFAVRIHGLESQPLFGAANIGHRPTVDGEKWQLEVHIFDFNQSIYGKHVEIEFCHPIREEKKFNSLAELTAQINKDCLTAKQFFGVSS